jgi:cellulose biosynthesis protein BcsQ
MKPFIVGFHSIRGGVGRTLLAANTATRMASSGDRVIAVDLDLEAPGLSLLWKTPNQLGFVEWCQEALRTDSMPRLHEFLAEVTLSDGSALHFMPVGVLDDSYSNRVRNLDWAGLFDPAVDGRGAWLLAGFRQQLQNHHVATPGPRNKQANYALVDSRPGLNDLSAIVIRHVADLLVEVFAPGNQSLEGLQHFLPTLKQTWNQGGPEDRALGGDLIPVLSRTESDQLPPGDVGEFEALWGRPMAATLPVDRRMPRQESATKGNSELGRAYDGFVRELRSYNADDLSLCVTRARESLSRSGGLANSLKELERARSIDRSDPRTLRLGAQLANLRRSPDVELLLTELYESGDRSAELAILLSEATGAFENPTLRRLVQQMSQIEPQVLVLVDGRGQTIAIDPDTLSVRGRSERTSDRSKYPVVGAFFLAEQMRLRPDDFGLVLLTESGELLTESGPFPVRSLFRHEPISWALSAIDGGNEVLLVGGRHESSVVRFSELLSLKPEARVFDDFRNFHFRLGGYDHELGLIAPIELHGELHVAVLQQPRGRGEIWSKQGPVVPLEAPRNYQESKADGFDRPDYPDAWFGRSGRKGRIRPGLIADPWRSPGLLYFSSYGAERLDLVDYGNEWEPLGLSKQIDLPSGPIEWITTVRSRQELVIALIYRDEIALVASDGTVRQTHLGLSRKAPIVAALSIPAIAAVEMFL